MSEAAQRAENQLGAGQSEAAITTALDAAGRGDSAAYALLASWRLIGSPLPRDFAESRKLLRRAVEIGHVDAALTEIALTANGTGAPPDWHRAVQLLREASRSDPVAADHLELIEKMSLDSKGDPTNLPASQNRNSDPDIKVVSGFASRLECAHLASIVSDYLEPATVFDSVSGKQVPHPIRTSDNAVIGPTRESLVVHAINRRIAELTGTSASQGEPLSVLRYSPGQQYRPHLDTLSNSTNQRIVTAILYLNEGFNGGETVFPLLDLTIIPQAGDLLIFVNVDAKGNPERLSQHAGLPVIAGAKWIATRWIRASPYNPWTDYGK